MAALLVEGREEFPEGVFESRTKLRDRVHADGPEGLGELFDLELHAGEDVFEEPPEGATVENPPLIPDIEGQRLHDGGADSALELTSLDSDELGALGQEGPDPRHQAGCEAIGGPAEARLEGGSEERPILRVGPVARKAATPGPDESEDLLSGLNEGGVEIRRQMRDGLVNGALESHFAAGELSLGRGEAAEALVENREVGGLGLEGSIDDGHQATRTGPALQLPRPGEDAFIEGREEGRVSTRLIGLVVAGEARDEGPLGRDRKRGTDLAELGLERGLDLLELPWPESVDLVEDGDDGAPGAAHRRQHAALGLFARLTRAEDPKRRVRTPGGLDGEALVLLVDGVGPGGVENPYALEGLRGQHDLHVVHAVPFGGFEELVELAVVSFARRAIGANHSHPALGAAAQHVEGGSRRHDARRCDVGADEGVDEGALARVEFTEDGEEEGPIQLIPKTSGGERCFGEVVAPREGLHSIDGGREVDLTVGTEP